MPKSTLHFLSVSHFLIVIAIIMISTCNKESSVESVKPPEGITINQRAIILNVNDIDSLSEAISPYDYHPRITNWETSDSQIVTVDNRGILTAIKPGEALIIVNADGDVFDTCHVTVVRTRNYDSSDGLLCNQVSRLAVDSTGNLWCATYHGASKFDGTNWRSYTQSDGLVDNRINSITVDMQNNVWFGTEGGVSQFNSVNWTSYTTLDGLCSDSVIGMTFDNRGNKWFGTFNGLSTLNGAKWTTYNVRNGLLGMSDVVIGIAIDDLNGDAWVITNDAVSVFNGISWTGYYGSADLGPTTIYNITIDNFNNKWLSTIDGFYKLVGTKWVSQINDTNYYISFAHDILFGKNGNIWFTTRDGIFKYNGRYIAAFKGKTNTLINKTEITDIAIDREENIWIAKTFEGIFKLETK